MVRVVAGADWCDVVTHLQGWAFVYQQGREIVCELDGVELWRTPMPERVLYLRAAVMIDGGVAAIGQGNDSGLARLIDAAGVRALGPSHGQNCTAIDAHHAYIQRSPTRYSRVDLVAGHDDERDIPIGATSQGFLDVDSGGDVLWTDRHRTATVEGHTLSLPMRRNGVTVGQADPPQIRAVGPGVASTVIDGLAFEPHVAALSDGRYAVCARTPRGATLVICPPWPGLVTAAPGAPGPVVTPAPPAEPLAITITEYREQGQVPMALYALYRVTGHGGQPVSVALTLDGARVSGSNAPAGRLEVELHEPGEYRLGAMVRCGDRTSQTGAVRIVRVLPAPIEPPPPTPPEPIKTGREGFTQAAEEAAQRLKDRT